MLPLLFFFSSRRRHTRWTGDWSSDVCSSDLPTRACASRQRACAPSRRRSSRSAAKSAPPRSEERRVGKSVDLGGRRIIKKKNKNCCCPTRLYTHLFYA